MTWLQIQSREVLEHALSQSPSCYLASALDGKIHWANQSFLNWMGYTLHELELRTWMDISVRDENLEADLLAAKSLYEGQIQTYSVLKQYIPKQARPRWGYLHVTRYPQLGPIEVCICTWKPVEDESSPAFARAVEAINKMSASLEDLKVIVAQIEEQHAAKNLVEHGIVIWLKIVSRYPKAAITVGLFLICLIGGSAAVNAIGAVKKIMTGDVTATP